MARAVIAIEVVAIAADDDYVARVHPRSGHHAGHAFASAISLAIEATTTWLHAWHSTSRPSLSRTTRPPPSENSPRPRR